MALVRKVKCAGLIFDGAADKVFNAALHLQVGQNLQRMFRGTEDVQMPCLSKKWSKQTFLDSGTLSWETKEITFSINFWSTA